MTTTLVTDGFKDETPEPVRPTGMHHIVYGRDTFVDTLDETTINALLIVGAIDEVATVKYPGGRTKLYVSVEGKHPRGFEPEDED